MAGHPESGQQNVRAAAQKQHRTAYKGGSYICRGSTDYGPELYTHTQGRASLNMWLAECKGPH